MCIECNVCVHTHTYIIQYIQCLPLGVEWVRIGTK